MPRSCGRGWRSCAAARRSGRRPSARCWRSRAATPTTGPPTRRCRCRSRPCTRDGFLGDLLAGRADRAITPVATAGGLPRAAAPLPAARACRGWRSSPSWGWAPAWPTTWASARPCSCSRWRRTSGPTPRPPTLLLCPMSLVGTWQREAAAVRPRAAGAARCTGRGRPHGAALHDAVAARRPGRHHVRHRHPRRRRAGRDHAGGGSCSTRRRRSRTAGRRRRERCAGSAPSTGSRSPAPRWRTGCPSCGR